MAKKKKKQKPQHIITKRNEYIYAIDASLKDTGVCIYSLDSHEIVYTGDISTDAIRNLNKYKGYDLNSLKLNIIKDYFEKMIKKYPPSLVVLEYGGTRFRADIVAQNLVFGVIKPIFWNCSQVYYTPPAVKKAICSGHAEKLEVRDVIIANIPNLKNNKLFYENDNVSDAVAVLITYLLKSETYDPDKWSKIKIEDIPRDDVIRVKTKPKEQFEDVRKTFEDLF